MLWSRSASLMMTTRTSSAMARNIFRMFSACCSSMDRAEPNLRELGDAVDQPRHLAPEALLEVRDGDVGVLGDVVQERGGDALGVHLQRRQLVGDCHRMGDVRLARGPQLALMGGRRDLVGALDQADVDARPMSSRLRDDGLDGGRAGRWLGISDALRHGGRGRPQACQVHGASRVARSVLRSGGPIEMPALTATGRVLHPG